MGEATRRLAAIMFTDLVGFTRLGQRDEELALRLRREHQDLIRPRVAAHGGREVKTLGDGLLVEFASAVESVRCAVEIQESVARRNARPGVTDPIVLRIGIHVGDVVPEGTDIVGDAVNVASRIEPLAEPGGICLSATVFEQVQNKLRVPLEKLGPRRLKHVDHPVDVYRVVLSGAPSRPPAADAEPGANVRFAVLPFTSRGPESGDDYLADGLTDELISHVARLPTVRVIARTSVLRYKGSSRSVREIGEELNVQLALEGSVLRAGEKVRVTAQLVDAATEESLWSARFDRPLGDIFAIQDEIASHIATAISGHLSRAGVTTLVPFVRTPADTQDLRAYSEFLRGRKLAAERGSEESMRLALEHFESAIALDPDFARARVGATDVLVWLAVEGALPYDTTLRRVHDELARSLAANENLAEAHAMLASVHIGEDDMAGTEREARRALELNPSLSDPYRWLAQIAAGDGRIDKAIQLIESAYYLDPANVNVIAFLGRLYFYAGRPADALAHWERTEALIPFRTNAHRTEYYLSIGDYSAAEAGVRAMERSRPASLWLFAYRGIRAARTGDSDGARRDLALLEQHTSTGGPSLFLAGFVRFALGDTDGFFAGVEAAFRQHQLPFLELLYSPLFASVRDDPRFIDLIRRQRALSRAPA